MKVISCLILVLCFGCTTTAFADDKVEEIKIRIKSRFQTDNIHEFIIRGHFSQPGFAGVQDVIFSSSLIEQVFSGDRKVGDSIDNFQEYKFLARTGEKNLEIKHINRDHRHDKKFTEDKLNLFFDKEARESIHLVTPDKLKQVTNRLFRECLEKNDFLLNLIELVGNRLKYQIIVPDCLRNPAIQETGN